MKNTMPSASLATFAWTVVFTILLAAFAFFTLLTNTSTEKIKTDVRILQTENLAYRKLDTCIAILYSAENNNRLFLVTQDSSYMNAYTAQLREVIIILNKYQTDRENKEKSISQLVGQKQQKNQEFIALRMMVDSLLFLSQNEITTSPVNRVKPVTTEKLSILSKKNDSTEVKEKRTRKRLVKRLMDAIRDKDTIPGRITKTYTSALTMQDSIKILLNKLEVQKSALLEDTRKKLGRAEKELLIINNRIFLNLQVSLQKLRNQELKEADALKSNLLSSAKSSSEEISLLMWASVLVVLGLAIIIIFNLTRIYRKDATILAFANLTAYTSKRKADFLAQVTHELRTPLNAIIGFANMIDTKERDQDLQFNINAIKGGSEIMLTLVNEILDISKFESGKITLSVEPFKPVTLVKESIALLGVLASQKRIVISMRSKMDESLTLLGDEFRIKQVIINLITNAIKFTPDGGNIIVKLSFENKAQGNLSIIVKDSGVGIAREHLESIFEDYSQVHNTQVKVKPVGTGLGLSICKRIVDLYAGKISVASVLGEGSEFKVSIPLKSATSAENAAGKRIVNLKPEPIPENAKMLIADDTRMNLILISRIVDKLGISYDLAENGQKAFEMFKMNSYDILITDIDMPILNGFELTERIRAHHETDKSAIPIIAFTGFTDEDTLAYAKSIGMNEILPKPFDESHFITVLTTFLSPIDAQNIQ